MIETLEVTNYRRFDHYKVDNIAPVNLFVGRNNVGKTSILEAVQLLGSNFPLVVLSDIARRRNEGARVVLEDQSRRWLLELVDISHAFHGHRVLSSEIKLTGGESANLRLTSTPSSKKVTAPKPESAVPTIPAFPTSVALYAIRDNKILGAADMTDSGHVEDTRRNRRTLIPDDRTIFISPESLSNELLPVLYNAVVTRAAESMVVRSLKLLDDSISGIYSLSSLSGADITPGELLLGGVGKERNPLGSFGDGMRRLLAIVMAFVNTEKGVLLIDEVETGLHYSVMADLWKLVINTSADLSTQVFATTHSLDCVRGLHMALLEYPSWASRVAVHKVDSRRNGTVTLTGAPLIDALNADLELR